jgi:hypothetical protein
MRLLRRDKRYMKMIAGGMYRTVSPKTKLPVPDDQLKAGIKKTVTKLPDPKPVTPKQRPNVGGGMSKAQEDAFEKEYEAFIAQQKKLKAEREAAEAAEAAKVETAEPEVDVAEEPVDVTEEPADEVVEEGEVTAESTEEVEPVQKKTSRKKKADAE